MGIVFIIVHSLCVGDLIVQLDPLSFLFGGWNIARIASAERARLLFAWDSTLFGYSMSKILVAYCNTGYNFWVLFACKVLVVAGTSSFTSVGVVREWMVLPHFNQTLICLGWRHFATLFTVNSDDSCIVWTKSTYTYYQ